MSFAVTASLGFLTSRCGSGASFSNPLPRYCSGCFSFLYYAVPNAVVSRRAALTGGVFAALAFSAMQKVFELFLVSSATLKSIYGAFAVFPVFLIWLQLSWAVVLLGGLIAATLNRQPTR